MIIPIPVTKGGVDYTVEVDFDKFSEEVFREICARGARDLIQQGMSKVTAVAYPDQDEREGAAKALAEKNLGKMLEGDIRFTVTRQKKKAAAGKREVLTEQKRIAKVMVKDEMKRLGIKVSYVEAKEITRCVNELIDGPRGPELWAKAEAAVEERRREAQERVEQGSDLGITIQVSDRKIKQATEKAERAKAKEKDTPISAKQAGVLASRGRPSQPELRH